MPFTEPQIRKLKSRVSAGHVKQREVEGKILNYIEGWHAISEANRIFGHDGWDRETLSTQCTWTKPVAGRYGAAYLTRVRLTVRAGEITIVREGVGSGESLAPTQGQAHERASKAAETDATKRALTTFGGAFGLMLYRNTRVVRPTGPAEADGEAPTEKPEAQGRRAPRTIRIKVDKSELAIAEPRRRRDPEHLRVVRNEPCLVCGRRPSQAHHLRFMQMRAMSRKVSDEFTVPLCSGHHDELHRAGKETDWWQAHRIDPVEIARDLWKLSHGNSERDSGPTEQGEAVPGEAVAE